MDDIRQTFLNVFREVFEDDSIELEDRMSAKDFATWDSLRHINLVIAVEQAFNIRFATAEISRLSEPDQNVGTFLQLVERKVPRPMET
jgi:acyl carrier protein